VTAYASLGTASPCDGTAGSFIKYKKISIRVTWLRMEPNTAPVRAETLLAPGASSFDPTKGNVGAKVLDALGAPVEGIGVTVTNGSVSRVQYTDDAGCAFFDGLTPGPYTATASASGYVASNGSFAPSQPASVTQGFTTPVAFDYDLKGSLAAKLGDPGYPVPANVPLSIGNTALLPDGHSAFAGTGDTRTLTDRFPFASGYTLWAGSCLDADPEGTSGSGPYFPSATRGTPVQATTSGAPPVTAVVMAQVRVTVRRDSSGVPIANANVRGAHAGSAFCDFPEDYLMGVTDTNGELRASMPWGTWNLTVTGYGLATAVTPVFDPITGSFDVEVRVL
jgi:hypothetical protein